MKPVTITAILALLLTIPFVIRHRAHVKAVRSGQATTGGPQEIRYDIDDLLS
jgi:hypothetical protein